MINSKTISKIKDSLIPFRSIFIVNGFTLVVQEDSENPVGTLKRRRAVAKNSKGTILLKGDESFSSGDKILLNELKFYIETNNLKAN